MGSSREINASVRLVAHNAGRTKSTKFGRPWILVCEEFFENYTVARKRETFLKSGQGRKLFMERWQSG